MSPTTGYATKDELYTVKQDLSKRIGDVELNLSLQIGKVQANVDDLRAEMNANFMQVFAAFIPIYQALGIDTDQLSKF